MAPPPANALANYHLTYVNDFNQTHLPRGWYPFTGVAGGDPTDQFSAHHLIVAQGLLRLKTYRDPSNSNAWTTAGLCQCGRPFTYGAVFVRSRQIGSAVNSAELLWPNDNSWPPEIDFNEDLFRTKFTTATIHWTGNQTNFHVLKIDVSRWHTYGVVWTPLFILFTVDGRPWHEFAVPTSIPHQPMNVDFEQRVNCPSPKYCPRQPSALLIDWLVEYKHN
ncbi:MAG: glycoside hydrolase family 16 protein [Actinomycetota bacterium]|nr:glycoside hydrolase family 16 protein [Actinomycetota bacterium]